MVARYHWMSYLQGKNTCYYQLERNTTQTVISTSFLSRSTLLSSHQTKNQGNLQLSEMNLLVLILMFVGLLMVQQGQSAVKKANPVFYKFYCGTYSKVLLSYIKTLISELKKNKGQGTHNCPKVSKNCAEVLKCGGKQSGVYSIDPDGKGPFKVYCDQKTNGGGWTVFQKRKDGSVDFYRGWNDYKNGFGDLKGEFWLGLDKIKRLTHQARNRLRVELEDTKGKSAYAEYDYFAVASERSKYKLSLGTYSGTAGDSLTYHRGMPFTTKDRDNDSYGKNCAAVFKGAWWFGSGCHHSDLNGLYHHGKHKSNADGVNWYHWKSSWYYSAKRAEMKIRPV